MKGDFIIVFVTAANKEEAEQIGHYLVEKKLIACCNMIEPIFSIFWWQGKISHENEVLLILKTIKKHFDRIVEEVRKLHSYDNPEIIALPIISGSQEYLNWVKDETF